MLPARDFYFDQHPDPMWIYDRATFEFLDVNATAVENYGYSKAEFLAMTLRDIRPKEDVPSFLSFMFPDQKDSTGAQYWRHRLKSGQIVLVHINRRPIAFEGRKAVMVSARNVSGLIEGVQTQAEQLSIERAARHDSEALARHFQTLFEQVPGSILVLHPDSYSVMAASNSYLGATRTARDRIIGRSVFALLPPQGSPAGVGYHAALRTSLARVIETRQPDTMALQKFPLHAQGDERYLAVANSPSLGADGSIVHIFHRIEDVTEAVGDSLTPFEPGGGTRTGEAIDAQLDLLVASHNLSRASIRLEEQEANLRTARRLLGVGLWKYDTQSESFTWSDEVYGIYGIRPGKIPLCSADYMALLHPDDRAAGVENLERFIASGETYFSFEHRVVHSDGRVVHVRGLGERGGPLAPTMLTGVVQDITAQKQAENALLRANHLIRIAGHCAKLGGWRYDALRKEIEWTPHTIAIHELPSDAKPPPIEEVINFYVPEARPVVSAAMQACLEHGTPFDVILQIVTAKGNRPWVRSIGEAERDENGTIIAVQGAFQDISDIVAASKHTDALDQRLSLTLAHMNDAVVTLDHELRFTSLNNHAERLFDHPSERYLGRQLEEAMPMLVGTQLLAAIERVASNRDSMQLQAHPVPSGRWMDFSIYAVPEGIVVAFADVTGQRTREAQLQLLESAMARVSDIVLITEAEPITGPNGPRIVYVNDAFVRRTGFSREEAIGRTPRILQGPRTQRDELDRIRTALDAWRPVRSELINYTKSGQEFWLELDITPIADDTGWFTHWVAIERDVTERRHAAAALEESEARLRVASEAAALGVFQVNMPEGTGHWSDRMWRIRGLEPQPGLPGAELAVARVHPDDLDLVRGVRKAAAAWPHGEVVRQQFRVVWPDRTLRHVASYSVALHGREEGTFTLIGVNLDVTEQVEREQALLETAARFELAIDAAGLAVWEWNPDTERMTWSPQIWEMLGIAPSDVIPGAEVRQKAIHPDDLHQVPTVWIQSASAGEDGRGEGEFRVFRQDGSIRYVRWQGIPLRDAQGRIVRFAGVMHDVTEARVADLALRTSEELFRMAAEAAEQGVWNHDLVSGAITWSARLWLIHGLPPQEGAPPREDRIAFIHHEDRADVLGLVDQLQAAPPNTVMRRVYRILRADGAVRTMDRQAMLVAGADGQPARIVGVVHDVTEARELEAQTMVADKLATLGEMAGAIAHELAQPLQAVMATAATARLRLSIAEDSATIQAVSDRLAWIESQTARAGKTIQHLLSFSRGESSDSFTRLAQAVEGAMELAGHGLRRAGITVEIDLPDDLPLVRGGQIAIEQVLVNLLNNARDAIGGVAAPNATGARAIRSIAIAAHCEGSSVSLEVTDTGGGIPPERIERIFEPFYTTKPLGRGTGIGLSIARRTMHAVGGTITVSNGALGAHFVLMFETDPTIFAEE